MLTASALGTPAARGRAARAVGLALAAVAYVAIPRRRQDAVAGGVRAGGLGGPAWRVRALPVWLRAVGVVLAFAIVTSGIGYAFTLAFPSIPTQRQ